MQKQIVVKNEVDHEWAELMQLARKMGLSIEEIRAFLTFNKK